MSSHLILLASQHQVQPRLESFPLLYEIALDFRVSAVAIRKDAAELAAIRTELFPYSRTWYATLRVTPCPSLKWKQDAVH